jgi:hypothetical protein
MMSEISLHERNRSDFVHQGTPMDRILENHYRPIDSVGQLTYI